MLFVSGNTSTGECYIQLICVELCDCCMTASRMNKAHAQLKYWKVVGMYLISIDPSRDSQKYFSNYIFHLCCIHVVQKKN